MFRLSIATLLVTITYVFADAEVPASPPKDVPPVIGTAVATPSSDEGDDDKWSIKLVVPKVAWEVIGEERPKLEWPEFSVTVEEANLTLPMEYHPATQLSDDAQNRVLDVKGKRLSRDEALKRLAAKTPVLVSVSGRMPDAFYLQCTKPDTLIVVLGIPSYPAPELLPYPIGANRTGRTEKTEAIQPLRKRSMKGWELYVWQEDGVTLYSLMIGTNRIKFDDEIAESAVRGFEAIQPKLDELRKGESICICGRHRFDEAPAAATKAVTDYSERIGLMAQ